MGNALLQVISGQDGSERREMTKRIVCSNNPIIMAFLNRVLNGPLPAYGKLYLRKTSALVATQKALSVLAKQCADASCEPTEVMTRSAVCTRHLTALIRHENPGMTTERRQKIHAVVSALTDTSTAETQGIAPATGILQRAQLLMQQDVPEATCAAIGSVFMELLSMLDADDRKRGTPSMAGHATSFTACLDHMVPGKLGEACMAMLSQTCLPDAIRCAIAGT